MHTDTQEDTELTSDSSPGHPGSICSGMFSGAQNLTVTGQTLTNITHNYPVAPTAPSDLRMVPLGEIDLYHEICLDNDTGVVGRAHESRRVRRVYSANVEGQSMTVAMYQGPGAEKEWRVEIRTYMSIRHPNIVQIRGAASSGGIHATLFHDDLIPFEHFLDLHRCSHFSTLYIYIYCGMDFRAATDYVYFIFQEKLNEEDCTLWIRRSTGRLCVELTESLYTHFYFCDVVGQTSTQGLSSWNALNAEDIIIQSLTIKHYHAIHFYQQRHFRPITISTPSAVRLAAILSCPPRNWVENHVEVAFLPNLKLDYGGGWTTLRGAPGERTEEGWTRFNSRDIFDSTLHLRCCVQISDRLRCWFSQANHIFSRLQVTSKFEDYYLVDMIDFEVKILSTTEGPPLGYLFLCPEEDLQTSLFSLDWAAYWSLHPSGVERLDTTAATELGFPLLQLNAQISGRSWDANVYAGIHQFHQAKGFDSASQEIARNLGEPLYQLCSEIDDYPFNNMAEDDFCANENHQDPLNVNDSEDIQSSAGKDYGRDVSMGRCEEPQALALLGEMPDVSKVFQFIMNVQFALILFLALSWIYGQV